MTNAINWFEIPSTDLERAAKFYETVFGVMLRREISGGIPNAIFPAGDGGVGGSVIQSDARPSKDGVIPYLNARSIAHLDTTLAKTPAAGGSVVMPKTSIGPIGWIAVIDDTEGNRIGLHCEAE